MCGPSSAGFANIGLIDNPYVTGGPYFIQPNNSGTHMFLYSTVHPTKSILDETDLL